MRVGFTKQKAFLSSVNARAEKHGDEVAPAGDLKFRMDLPNTRLDEFHPSLRQALFFHDTSRPQDLVDSANEENKDYLPHLRMPNLKSPLKWEDEMVGGKLTVHYGVGGRSDIVLDTIKVAEFEIVPKEGGTVELTLRVQAHPDEKQRGKLWGMIQTQVEITIEPPAPEDAQEHIPETLQE